MFRGIKSRIKGNEHPDSLKEQCQLAIDLGDRELYTEAEKLHRQTWQTRQRVLGQEDPDTLLSQSFLAETLSQLKRYDEAEVLHREAWQIRQLVLGQEDPNTLWSQYQLAVILSHLKRYTEAEKLSRKTWQTRRHILGQEDPTTLESQMTLGFLLGRLKKWEEAEKINRQAWQLGQRVFGECSHLTLQCLINLSWDVFNLERYALALELGQEVLSKIVSLPLDDRESMEWNAKYNAAQFLFENGRDYEAEKTLYNAIQEGHIDDPEAEAIMRWYLAAISTSIHSLNSPIPAIDAALVRSEHFPSGKRLLKMIDRLSDGYKSSSHPELKTMSFQGTDSSATCQESKTFLKDLVSQAEPSISSIETTISTIRKDDVIPTILELDIYYATPNQTHFITRNGHLDTKARADYISSDLAELLGHRMHIYEGGQISTAAGPIKPIGQVSLYFEWQKSSKLRKRTFSVVTDLPFDIILGIDFITEFEIYRVGNTLLVMALSPLRKDEKKELQIRAAQNRKRRDAEEKLEEEQNRLKRIEKLLAREANGSAPRSASGQGNVTRN